MKIPVLLTIFNRKDTALEALKSIKAYQPEKLYIATDGPRTHKEGEEQACADTRQAVMDAIDWPCQVQTLFREENLGCAWAMYGAIRSGVSFARTTLCLVRTSIRCAKNCYPGIKMTIA